MNDEAVDVEGECWPWQGPSAGSGYGGIQVDGKTKRAHRVVYESVRGPIPDSLVLDHLCRNRCCVNPWHLEPVPVAENTMRGYGAPAINARKTHCQYGHEFTPENTRVYQNRRVCRECHRLDNRERMRGYRQAKRFQATEVTNDQQ